MPSPERIRRIAASRCYKPVALAWDPAAVAVGGRGWDVVGQLGWRLLLPSPDAVPDQQADGDGGEHQEPD